MAVSICIYHPTDGLSYYEDIEAIRYCTPDVRSWIDIESNSPEELGIIASHLGLHELTVEDCFTPGHFPKMEEFGRYNFFLFRSLKSWSELEEVWSQKENDIDVDDLQKEFFTRKVAIYLSEQFVVTFRQSEVSWLDAAVRQVKQIPDVTIESGTDVIAHRVIDVLVDRFLRGLGFFEDLIDKKEDLAFESSDDFDLSDIMVLKRELISLRQIMRDQRAIIRRLANEGLIKEKRNRRYFADVEDHAVTIVNMLDKQIDSILGLRDAYVAMANVRLGDTMRILTVITTIATPLNIVVGFYGMNFEALPLLHNQHGFWVIIFAMITLTVTMLFYFRRKKWL